MRPALLRVVAVLLVVPWGAQAGAALPPSPAPGVTVRFFDVGQGDAALIESPTGKTILIDGGPPEAGEALVRRLRGELHAPLDLVLLTHPHLDHLGGLAAVLQAVGAKRYMDPGFVHPGQAYTALLETVERLHIPYVQPELDPAAPDQPVSIGLGGGAVLTVLWPRRPTEPFLTATRSDVNANSIVVRLSYGTTALLFAGDAEPETELHLLHAAGTLRAEVLKVGHHGSRHSTTAAWLRAVRPEVAVVSCGVHNDFGHPAEETLERLRAAGAAVFRTDQQGDILAVSDGSRFSVRPMTGAPASPSSTRGWAGHSLLRTIESFLALDAAPAGYVASRRSEVFHRATCPAVAALQPDHRVFFASREEAARNHRPAKDCHP